jgi:hypothetical protein
MVCTLSLQRNLKRAIKYPRLVINDARPSQQLDAKSFSFIADSAIKARAVTSTKSIRAIKIQITGNIGPKPINKKT